MLDKAEYSAFESMLNFSIVLLLLYRIVCHNGWVPVGTVNSWWTLIACVQTRNTLLVSCAAGQVLEIEAPEPEAHDPVNTYEIKNLHIRTHQFKSIKSVLLVSNN